MENECVPTFLKIFTPRISNVSLISSANVCKIPIVRLRNTLLGSHLRSAHVFLFFFLYLSTSPTRHKKYSSLCYLEFLLSCWCCWWRAPWITTFFFLYKPLCSLCFGGYFCSILINSLVWGEKPFYKHFHSFWAVHGWVVQMFKLTVFWSSKGYTSWHSSQAS